MSTLRVLFVSTRSRQIFLERLRDETGQDVVEYVLLVSIVALGVTASMRSVGDSINLAYAHLASTIADYTGSATANPATPGNNGNSNGHGQGNGGNNNGNGNNGDQGYGTGNGNNGHGHG